MNIRIERLSQEIGNELLDFLGDDVPDILAYSEEVADGVCSAGIVYRENKCGKLVYKFPTNKLSELFNDLWDAWPADLEKWKALEYVLRNGKFDIAVIYNDQFNADLFSSDRREVSIKKYFGNEMVDYSRPE